MTLFLRLLLLLFSYRFRPACEALGPARKRFLVGPADLDVLLHVNNGVYLTMLDVARVDLLLRSGLLGRLRRNGIYPVVAAQTIRFRRSLQLFQSFEVETRVLGWDDKAFILRHEFLRRGELVADAVVRWRFLRRRRAGGASSAGSSGASPREVLQMLGLPDASPTLPEWVDAWNRENAR